MQVGTTYGKRIVKGCCSTILIMAAHLRLQPGSMRPRLFFASRIASREMVRAVKLALGGAAAESGAHIMSVGEGPSRL